MIDRSLLKTEKQKQEWHLAEEYLRYVLNETEEEIERVFYAGIERHNHDLSISDIKEMQKSGIDHWVFDEYLDDPDFYGIKKD